MNKERLLVHACCAPCSTVPLERLRTGFELAFFFYGPNIHPAEEYRRRLAELRSLGERAGIPLYTGEYLKDTWERAVAPYRHQAESSHAQRCQACYRLRMEATARLARREGFDRFTVTLSVSRHKSSKVLARLGAEVAQAHGLGYLAEDFKKRAGASLAAARSRELGLYRQDYCGCELSLAEAVQRRRRSAAK